jgi:hypothetical protein
MTLRLLSLITTAAAFALPHVVTAQVPVPQAASQNPSPMVEGTRAHDRLAPKDLGGATRSFPGPSGKAIELWVPDRARERDVFDLVIHFLGAAWLPQQAVAGLGDQWLAAVVNLGAGSGVYHRAFADASAFDSLLAGVTREASALIRKTRGSGA